MVKIPDLTNKQLVAQLEKYERIMQQLLGERSRRAQVSDTDDLYTKKENAQKELEKQAAGAEEDEDNLLSFDEDELNAIEKETSKTNVKEEDDEEEVRVTQLLQLSKEDLAALQSNKKRVKKKG